MPEPLEIAVLRLSERLDRMERINQELSANTTSTLLALRLIVTEIARTHPATITAAQRALDDTPAPLSIRAMARATLDTLAAD